MQETPVLLNRLHFPVLFSLILCILVSACTATRPAPVIERAPVNKSAKPTDKDWRPDSYTVKKGDTLYSIGLEYGYDYKDIAEANHLQSPYTIYIGQQLSFKQIKGAPTTTVKNVSPTNDGGVIVKPLNTEANPTPTKPTATAATPVLTGESLVLREPKAIKEPYSTQALAMPPAAPTAVRSAASVPPVPPTAVAPVVATAKPADTPAATGDDEDLDWAWPASGKLISGFNDAESAKGIDIAGTQGQAVLAAAAGKVIYSGSDLRGYGKLVIIKHNKTYLSVYAHNSAIVIKEGQQVAKGQKIAEMGNSDADQVKLHFEIRRQGKSVDPAKYLSGNP
ncbi:peptidoglycan DD-metalloendopeptidase family protein [Methyloradius palustris]|uniref:Peptidase n=1 Tax=Methyloradius palustris TaxID=2778876 RepID=A0A8D5G7J5_9PROT|nr:peptidoglycan DD-metalloendopeptidase family protein [Methyloradius palustris]BCM24651.1 peptidase [Methyloradius palustris]